MDARLFGYVDVGGGREGRLADGLGERRSDFIVVVLGGRGEARVGGEGADDVILFCRHHW